MDAPEAYDTLRRNIAAAPDNDLEFEALGALCDALWYALTADHQAKFIETPACKEIAAKADQWAADQDGGAQ